MVQINFGQREVSCKIVFYGPGMSGKTTNLEVIHQKAPKQAVGEMVSIATETDRTLYFDFMPMDLGQVAGMHTKFMLYTVPGQIYYNATRKLVLQGVDGIIFVADSDPNKMGENLESLQNLRDNLAEMGLSLEDIPLVLQYNKRDLPGAMPVPDMNAKMNPMGVPTFEACARDGRGVFATLKEVSRLVIEKLNREHAPAANRRRTASSLTPPDAGNAMPATPGPMPVAAMRSTPPPPPRTAVTNTPPGVPASRGASGGRSTVAPPRPMLPPASPAMPRSPAATLPRTPSNATTVRPQNTTPARPHPVVDDLSPREKHLAKAKPAPLAQRQGGKVNLGNTDPNLKRYQEQRLGGGAMRIVGWALIALIVATILLVVLAFVSPAVASWFPLEWQQRIHAFKNPGSAASTMEPAAETPPAAPLPATAPAPEATAAVPPTITVPPAPATTPPAVKAPRAPIAAPPIVTAPQATAPIAPAPVVPAWPLVDDEPAAPSLDPVEEPVPAGAAPAAGASDGQ